MIHQGKCIYNVPLLITALSHKDKANNRIIYKQKKGVKAMGCEISNSNGCMFEELNDNINSVITCYTDGHCFSGLLLSVTDCAIKMITRCNTGCPPSNNSCYGKVTVIPRNKINAITLCNTSS